MNWQKKSAAHAHTQYRWQEIAFHIAIKSRHSVMSDVGWIPQMSGFVSQKNIRQSTSDCGGKITSQDTDIHIHWYTYTGYTIGSRSECIMIHNIIGICLYCESATTVFVVAHNTENFCGFAVSKRIRIRDTGNSYFLRISHWAYAEVFAPNFGCVPGSGLDCLIRSCI